jgi:hypothetical protein
MVVGAVSNIALDWLFIFPLQMGVKGAAIASGLGQVLACCCSPPIFIRKKVRFLFLPGAGKKGFIGKSCCGFPRICQPMGQPVTFSATIVVCIFG